MENEKKIRMVLRVLTVFLPVRVLTYLAGVAIARERRYIGILCVLAACLLTRLLTFLHARARGRVGIVLYVPTACPPMALFGRFSFAKGLVRVSAHERSCTIEGRQFQTAKNAGLKALIVPCNSGHSKRF